ncbi:MAG: hypothetical protein DME23_06855 [Verrucomicrobia bacterium]|nr:MAG: hypothetical protein DME23_06855 [Verrucomicrobiota bacterium]
MPSVSLNIARYCPLLAALLCGTQLSFAQLPAARLSTIFPPGGKAGTTFEVTVTGSDLDDDAQLHFSHANITARQKVADKTGEPEANKFLVTIGADVPSDVYEARVIGRFGVSNPRAYAVGDLPETPSPATNHAVASAVEVPLGTVVNGRAEANAVDYFKFAARKGQRVLIECLAKEIDSRMDDTLILYDAGGHELERQRRGGLLDFIAPADGQFVLALSDFIYRGGREYFYRLTVGAGPRLDYILPPSALPGAKGNYTLYGRNLPGGKPARGQFIDGKPLEQLSVEIELPGDTATQQRLPGSVASKPAAIALDGIQYRLRTPQGVSNPVLLSFATAPVVAEREPNDKPQQAQKISLPCEVVGQFYPAGDKDCFTFNARKGEVYWIEIFSQRLNLPTAPFALLQRVTKNDKGEENVSDAHEFYAADTNLGGPEFNTTSRDWAWRFEAKEDGACRLEVRDLFNRYESNPRFVYRLSLSKETPDFRLVALPQAPPPVNKDAKEAALWTAFLRRGETMPIKVLAFRRDNFDGQIDLSIEGLPPGVACSLAKIETNKTSASIFLTAAENADSWFGPIKVVGKAKVGDKEVARGARSGSVTWNVPDYNNEAVQSRLTRDFFLAVSSVESAPITIEPAENKVWEAKAGGKLQIPLKLARHGEFNESLKLKATGAAGLDGLKELDVDGKTNAATLEIDFAQHKLPPGASTFYLQTQTKGKYRNNPDAAKTADEAAKQAEKFAAESAAEAKQATEAVAVAAKTADEAAAQAKSVSEDEKSDAEAKAQAAADAKAAAERAAREATAKAKEAEEKKSALQKRAKELEEKAKPREVTITVYSTPITIQVEAAEKK